MEEIWANAMDSYQLLASGCIWQGQLESVFNGWNPPPIAHTETDFVGL